MPNALNLYQAFYDRGLSFIPCREDKSPCIKWAKYQTKRPKMAEVDLWISKYPRSRIGLLTGTLNNITVIDCDDKSMTVAQLEAKYGETPFVVETPRGWHLYYSCSGECNRVKIEGQIDVRGNGGYVIFPSEGNAAYRIHKGHLDDLKCLPILKPLDQAIIQQDTLKTENDFISKEGTRNNDLFDCLKAQAANATSLDSLIAIGVSWNRQHCKPALAKNEVFRTAKQVWQYKVKNRLINKGERAAMISKSELTTLSPYPNAHVLYTLLKLEHWDIENRPQFAISQEAVAKRLGWLNGRRRVSSAIKNLIKLKIIKLAQDKQGYGNANQYSFC